MSREWFTRETNRNLSFPLAFASHLLHLALELWDTVAHHIVSVQHVDGRLVTQDWATYVLRMLQIMTKQYYSLMTAGLPL